MNLSNQIEAILFVADSPVPAAELAKLLDVEETVVRDELRKIAQVCSENRGIQLMQIAGGFQFSTKPEMAEIVARFLRPARQKLTRSQLETLAIVAYRQPVTMAEIEAVRGVQSDHTVRALLDRRMVKEVGRKQTPGRPLLYGTSEQFLHQFKLNDLSELPQIDFDSIETQPESEPVESSELVQS